MTSAMTKAVDAVQRAYSGVMKPETARRLITAADEARAVTDEEVVSVIGSAMARYITAYRERGSKPDLRTSDLAQAGLDELHAAGFKLIRA